LDKPFLKIARTKIDVHTGKLTMEFGDYPVQFSIPDIIKQSIQNSIFFIDILSDLQNNDLFKHFDFF